MAQNIYDRPEFFAGYSRLTRSVRGLDGAPEWPRLQAMLPDLNGKRVLDLGCGFGWFCRWARAARAERVLGLDLSGKMLARAKAETADESIAYERANLETIQLPPEAFDLVYSSLAFHYVEDAGRLYAEIYRSLVPGGRLVFSTEHPIFMAPSRPGWMTAEGGQVWALDSYSAEGPRTTDWLTNGVVKHHRTIGTTLNILIASGFSIRAVEEFAPTAEQIAARPEFSVETQRPMFLLVAAEKSNSADAVRGDR